MSIVSGPMGPTLGVSFKGGADALGVRVSDLLRDSVDQGGAVEMAAAQEPAGISVTPTEPTKFEFSVAADGTIWYGTEDAVEPFAPGGGKTGPERARAMLALRDGARALLALERDPAADDDEVEEAIAELSAEYDSFFERFGRINSKKNLAVFPSKGFTDHSLALNLLSLEKVDSDGEVTGKADILRKRLVTPEAPTPEHVGNPSDALAVTIDARGEVDIDFLADLMETDVQAALERLGDLVVTDPDDASHVMTADEYLSGDVGGKLEHVRELLEAERGRAERQTQQAWNEHLCFAVDAENLTGPARDALAQLRKTHLWESSLNPTTSRFAVDGHAHVEGLDHGARRIDWTSWPALVPLALEAYDGPRPIGLADCDERAGASPPATRCSTSSPAGWATSVPGAPAARSRPRPPTRSNTSSATAAFPMRSLAPSSPPAALSPTTARTTSRPSNPSPASRSSAPNARCTAAPRPGSRQSRTACASRAPSGRHRTPSSTCSASSGSSARMSA